MRFYISATVKWKSADKHELKTFFFFAIKIKLLAKMRICEIQKQKKQQQPVRYRYTKQNKIPAIYQLSE